MADLPTQMEPSLEARKRVERLTDHLAEVKQKVIAEAKAKASAPAAGDLDAAGAMPKPD